jgi:hypothetical protein
LAKEGFDSIVQATQDYRIGLTAGLADPARLCVRRWDHLCHFRYALRWLWRGRA